MRFPDESQDEELKELAFITMELMQKYVKDDGVIGIDNLGRSPSDSQAVSFLSAITCADAFDDLKTVSSGKGNLL